MPAADAPVITSDEEGSFAWSVLAERHPALIRQVCEATPYPPEVRRALDALLEEALHGVIMPLPPGAHDHEHWAAWSAECLGRSWYEVSFLWAESYFYRRLLQAVGYFAPGVWQGIDPFGPFKRAELRGAAVEGELAALDDVAGLPREEQDAAVLGGALWGNRADLGFRISAGQRSAGDAPSGGSPSGDVPADTPATDVPARDAKEPPDHLVVDEAAAFWDHLARAHAPSVHVLADNAGRELIPDLILLDHLLTSGRAASAVLHVKPYPYYVSDATLADVLDCVRRVAEAPGRAGSIGARLFAALTDGRLTVRAHPFACAPLPYADMPADLRADLAQATVTISKGDLNYRRLVGDRLWPATTPFAALTSAFPSPLLALRTLKSEVAVGVSPDALAALEAGAGDWRTSGTHAVVQFRG